MCWNKDLCQPITNLSPVQKYYVQVSALNSLGFGKPLPSTPAFMSPRKKKHSKQTKVILKLQSSRSIEVVFAAPESDGGDHITKYKIEWDLFPVFDSNEEYPLGSYSKIVPIGMNDHGSYFHIISGLSTGALYYIRI